MIFSKYLIKRKSNLIFFICSLILNLGAGVGIAEAKSNEENKSIKLEYNAGVSHVICDENHENLEMRHSTIGAEAFVTDNTKVSVEYGSGSIKFVDYSDIIPNQKIYLFSLGLDHYAENYFVKSQIGRLDSQFIECNAIETKIGHDYKISDNVYAQPMFGISSKSTTVEIAEYKETISSINVAPELLVGANFDIADNIKLQPEVAIKYQINMFNAADTRSSVASSINLEVNRFNFKLKANSYSDASYDLGFTFGVKI